MKKIAIIGSSAAGYSLAARLAQSGEKCSLTVVTQEPYPAYDRRKLLGYFAGTVKEKELFLPLPAQVVLRDSAKVTGVNCDRKMLYLKTEEKRDSIPFDFLAVCSGSVVDAPDIPGSHKEGVFCFNGLEDVKAAKACVVNGPVCMFGGWNAGARRLAECLVSMKREVLFVCPEVCEGVPEGVAVVNSAIIEFIGESGLQAIKLREGKIIGTSFCLITGPLSPRSDFLADSGIGLGAGGFVTISEGFRTSREHVFACGSVTGGCDTWDAASAQGFALAEILEKLL